VILDFFASPSPVLSIVRVSAICYPLSRRHARDTPNLKGLFIARGREPGVPRRRHVQCIHTGGLGRSRAWDLLRAVDDPNKGKSPSTRVPTAIKEIGVKAFALLKQGRVKKTDSPLIRKIINGAGGSLLVCAFGLPDIKDLGQPRLLLLLERIGRREEAAAQQAKAIFRLTEREVQVVQHLLKGWSNKAIAYELQLSEQTVKEHLQRIMAKTKSASRTGILARVLFL
jgi:DNA-binding CsgD family transcriptional regulator